MDIYKVVVTGPESTGKSSLSKMLALHYGTVWVPEYSREYVAGLGRKYNYDDVEHIAREQVRREKDYISLAKKFIFFDTHLIVTKVWFRVVYGRYPEWIDDAIRGSCLDLFLLCNTDIPWIADPVRENGGEMREKLLEMYMEEITSFGFPWKLISGRDHNRILSAIKILDTHFKQ
jgi:NadR type nicotinamide-nucleotide adenylyltransferase